ncbi:hypothetical protein [Paraprevotella clara]|uniref:hypothetical protein n=1 Tax=Paraprevotella clara TaxID=454154 RepID=UPI003FF0C989
MKNLKQLVLPCYKVEVAMGVEAWYFLHGTTCGVCNLTYFLSLISIMTVTETRNTKRGLSYVLHPGQADGSMLSLAKDWGIGRKAVSRLLEDFSERGLVRVVSNPMTSLIDMVCVKSWMKDGRLMENPTFHQSVKAYEGVRIYLFNGQRLETLRHSSARKKTAKSGNMPLVFPASTTSNPVTKETDTDSAVADTGGTSFLQSGDALSGLSEGHHVPD